MIRIIYILLFFSCLTNAFAFDNVESIPNPKTADANAFVSNPDHILSNKTVEKLNSQLYLLEQETSAEIAVVAVNSIENQDIADFANTLFNYWGIGKADKDNGALVLFVLDQKKIRFEVGYGLEGVLPDAICKRIQMQVMIPELKNDNYDAGILEGVKAAESYIREGNYEYTNTEKSPLLNIMFMVNGIFLFVALIPIFLMQRNVRKIENDSSLKNNQERYEKFISSPNYNVIFGCLMSFIGVLIAFFGLISLYFVFFIPLIISFISIILSVLYKKYWKKKFRKKIVFCPKCGRKMNLLSEEKDNEYLNIRESLEDELQSIDTDVFRCEDCDENVIFRYDNPSSKYKVCPSCNTKTMFLQESKTLIKATYVNEGLKEETYCCKFCHHTKIENVTLPCLERDSDSRSSSSSGGSFGGGRSGGGGSTSSW